MYNKSTKFDENRWSRFWENENKKIFLCELPLILRVDRKRKKKTGCRYLQGDPRYRIWTRLVSWIRRSVRRRSQRKTIFFFTFRNLSGKSRKCHVIGFRMYCKLTKFDQFRWSHFWENRKFYNFSLCERPLILRVGRKRKIMARYLQEFERDWWVGLGPELGDGKKFKIYFSSFRGFSGKIR